MREELNWNLKRAAQRGLIIVEPRANQLQIDLDSARALRKYGMQYSILRRAGICKGWKEKITPSSKKGHVHVTITMPYALSLIVRVGLQAILGSDLGREAFNYCRAVKGGQYPVVFFEKTKKCKGK